MAFFGLGPRKKARTPSMIPGGLDDHTRVVAEFKCVEGWSTVNFRTFRARQVQFAKNLKNRVGVVRVERDCTLFETPVNPFQVGLALCPLGNDTFERPGWADKGKIKKNEDNQRDQPARDVSYSAARGVGTF